MMLLDYFKLGLELCLDFLRPSLFSKKKDVLTNACRNSICSNVLYVGLHEWGGYDLVREKRINQIEPFICGIRFQIERLKFEYKGCRTIDLTITLSDPDLHNNIEYLKKSCDHFIVTNNKGMDFAGYKAFYDTIKDKPNSYILLTNSSVSNYKANYIDEYIDYMEKNKDVGILGISYNSKCYASFVRNNFNPHLQSFFLLTTTEVLSQIVSQNKGNFPGANVELKQLLIRNGEIKLSQLAMKLGYNLAVVTEDGNVVKFSPSRETWKLKFGDCRIGHPLPNSIMSIKSDSN